MREWRGFILIAHGKVIAGRGFFLRKILQICAHANESLETTLLIGWLVLLSFVSPFREYHNIRFISSSSNLFVQIVSSSFRWQLESILRSYCSDVTYLHFNLFVGTRFDVSASELLIASYASFWICRKSHYSGCDRRERTVRSVLFYHNHLEIN